MNKILIIVMYIIVLLLQYLQYKKSSKLLQKQFKEDIYCIQYQLLVNKIKNLELFHKKGGTYIIPVEVMNQINGMIEDWDDLYEETRK